MDFFEELAMWHLTHNGDVFVCPQFSIDGGWSCPDFIALDLTNKVVSVVEVTAAHCPRGLFNKVVKRHEQWLSRLKEQLPKKGLIDDSWKDFRVVLYIRQDARKRFEEEFGKEEGVEIRTLEDIAFPWKWEWVSAKLKKEVEQTSEGVSAKLKKEVEETSEAQHGLDFSGE
jgi:hypothetical protein